MQYHKFKQKIVIDELSQFDIRQILDCGQIFRYFVSDNIAEVVSGNRYAQIVTYDNRVEILTSDVEYFERFFDLDRDYNIIKQKLSNDQFLAPCITFGYGIRILNQQLFEMIVSFIVSANNNIKRIKNSLNYLSKIFGTKVNLNIDCIKNSPLVDEYSNAFYAFPTLNQLKNATVNDFVNAGLGYRAEYMYETIQKLTEDDLYNFGKLDMDSQIEFLLSLKGVGEKVAHCIMLFAAHQTSVFPVDTWINKVYNDLTNTTCTNRKLIAKILTDRYGELSGYAQQYFFYYYRTLK